MISNVFVIIIPQVSTSSTQLHSKFSNLFISRVPPWLTASHLSIYWGSQYDVIIQLSDILNMLADVG